MVLEFPLLLRNGKSYLLQSLYFNVAIMHKSIPDDVKKQKTVKVNVGHCKGHIGRHYRRVVGGMEYNFGLFGNNLEGGFASGGVKFHGLDVASPLGAAQLCRV